jgi:WD40 repeat protein
MTTDMVLERIRAANPALAHRGDYDELFQAIVATQGDPRLARRRRRRVTGPRLVLVALVVFLILAGTATAMYFAFRDRDSLTFPSGGSIASVVGSGPGVDPVLRCPGPALCSDITGIAWSPDGERLALMLGDLGGNSRYVGFHLIDLRTGSDRLIRTVERTFGCSYPGYPAWSPDGKLLAYTCRGGTGPGRRDADGIYTIRPTGSGRRLIPTGPFRAFSPTWSPDSRQIVFSTGETPLQEPMDGGSGPTFRSALYVIDVAGTHARRIALGALPDWSPDGKTIAYFAPGCGHDANDTGRIRLVTPTGRDVTPRAATCDGIGPVDHPVPAWSPDGRHIAVHTNSGLYLMNADGTDLHKLQRRTNLWLAGDLRPAWRPK